MTRLQKTVAIIALAMFLAVAVFFEWSSANAPRPEKQTSSNQQTTNRPENNDPPVFITVGTWAGEHHDAIEALAAVLSVIFTVALVGSNIALWRVTRKAANAAQQAAESLLIVERAYVYPIIVAHGAVNDCIRYALGFYPGDSSKGDIPAPMTTEMAFKFKNFGKTPAILKSAFVGFGVSPLGAEIGLSIPEGVLGVLEETNEFVSGMPMGITRNQAQHIAAYTGQVCFIGTITFDDIWSNEHTTRFYFVWDKEIERLTLRGVRTETKQKDEQPQKNG